MGGKEGGRGYLIQTVIALLESLDDERWDSVTIEPSNSLEKVDVQWVGAIHRKAVQVKSSIRQIGKANAEQWASELETAASAATELVLILVGPCAQSVAEMGSFNKVSVPCPKNLDIPGLLNQAAHLLDKFLAGQQFGHTSPSQREIFVSALATKLSVLSAESKDLSRAQLVELLKSWVSSIAAPVSSAWECVDFGNQRGIESAVAGIRLGPGDVAACPEFSICREIVNELQRSHLYEIVGTPGCGKSITGWQAAKRFRDLGFSVWRPRPFVPAVQLLADMPCAGSQLLVVDDAQQYGKPFANRLAEASSGETKILLISTVTDRMLSSAICISPHACMNELKQAVLIRRCEFLPIVRRHDERVGDRYFDQSLEDRIEVCARQNTPWEFFWVLRGAWQTARREYDSLLQFPSAVDVLLTIAIGQVVTCDVGVTYDWLQNEADSHGMPEIKLKECLKRLEDLGLIICSDAIRTKHLQYAYALLEESSRKARIDSWPFLVSAYLRAFLDTTHSLKEVSWLLDSATRSSEFLWKVRADFVSIVDHLVRRCVTEPDDVDWAAGCFSRLVGAFDFSPDAILKHKEVLLAWISSGSGLVSHFCGGIVNHLINGSKKDDPATRDAARNFIESVDVERLVVIANQVKTENFQFFGSLLNRLAFYGPGWATKFIERLDWARLRNVILAATPERAYAVDKLVASICFFTRRNAHPKSLRYIEEISAFIVRAVGARPADTMQAMDDIWWECLGYMPKMFRGGRSPDEDQIRVATAIVSQFQPEWFANVMNNATPRDLESLARCFEIIRDVEREFVPRVAKYVCEPSFLAATSEDWKSQSSELNHLIRFFCAGDDAQPASEWIRQNRQRIVGPLTSLFVCIAPDVALEFHKAGRGVEIVASRQQDWRQTTLAIIRLAHVDKAACIEIIDQQLGRLVSALYQLHLGTLRPLLSCFRLLYELSPDIYERFIAQLDLSDQIAERTIESLANRQPRERIEYLRLARLGLRCNDRLGALSREFLDRLEAKKSG